MKNLRNSLLLCGIVFFWVPAAANAQVAPPRGAEPRRQFATPKLLLAPVDWRFEAMPLPPRFAPEVKWTGFEEIRFAPGVFDNSSPNYFSYVMALSVNGTSAIDAAGIKDFLETYFRGLLPGVGQRKGLAVNASSTPRFSILLWVVWKMVGNITLNGRKRMIGYPFFRRKYEKKLTKEQIISFLQANKNFLKKELAVDHIMLYDHNSAIGTR